MTEHDAMREAVRADILRAFGLKPWHIGLAPVPRHIRIWRTVTLAKRRRKAYFLLFDR